ncbi:DUF1585 domain-containing protein, partial [Akkermansiaceae bacterium]|nr:DUF1585 domain-containing protein [Akkermansiaceae bacterium]
AIGFGLENFDTIGRWRDSEKVGRKKVPIQSEGTLPGGGEFQNVSELKTLLLKHEGALAKELTKSILSYALGRTVEFSDSDEVETILANVVKDKYRFRDIIREVALSSLFRRK